MCNAITEAYKNDIWRKKSIKYNICKITGKNTIRNSLLMYLDFNEFSNEQHMIFMFSILSTGEMNSEKTTKEFRSYAVPLPQAVMVDWTATATKEKRDKISKLIGIIGKD